MKKIWILTFFIQSAFTLVAQEWIQYYGYGLQPHCSYCNEHYDKGYLMSGDLNSYKYGWLIKTDINGNMLWDIKIGDGINHTSISDVENTVDNGLILCGGTELYNPLHSDPLIMKLNSCGELEWCKVLDYDNAGDDGIRVKQTLDGGFILCAILYGDNPNNIVHLFKFDSGGDLFWHKIYNGDSLVHSEFIRDMIVDGQYFLLTGDCYYPNWLKPYYIQTDTSGIETWILAYGQHLSSGYVGDAWATVRDKHGNYYSAGSKLDTYPELLKFSSLGLELLNVDLIPTSSSGGARTITALDDTSYVLSGQWNIGSNVFFGILKSDTFGNLKSSHYLPNPENVIISWSTKTTDNKVLLAVTDYVGGVDSRIELFKFNSDLEYDSVYTRHFTYDSLCPHPIVSDTINPNCGVLVGVDEPLKNPETGTLKVFPNPAKQKITVEFPKYIVVKTSQSGFGSTTVYHHWRSTILEVYDLTGKKVFDKEIIRAQTTLEMDVSGWTPALYYFRLVYNKQTVGEQKVLISTE